MSAPVGWTVIKPEPDAVPAGPSSDDLMAIADAVREAGARESSSASEILGIEIPPLELGRRGHLRAIPN